MPEPEQSPAPMQRTSAWHLLFDDPAKATAELSAAIGDKGVLEALPENAPRMSAAASKFLLGSTVGAIESVLAPIGIGSMLTDAWSNLEKVEQAIQVTAKEGGKRNISVLSHQLSSSYAPRIDMLVNEIATPLLHLLFDAAFVIKGCDITVVNGVITSVDVGHAGVVASLATSGITVLKHQIEKLDLAALFKDKNDEADQTAAT